MKKIIFSSILLIISLVCATFIKPILAANSYTIVQVAEHNIPTDCWMVIDNNVYDLTNYLDSHDNMLDIRSWCGQDATVDYNTKAGMSKDHSSRADSLLADYLVGSLNAVTSVNPSAESITTNATIERPAVKDNLYNVILPLILTTILYLVSLKLLSKPKHNFIWNTILLLGLIPSFIFGLILALNLNGANMLYNHVEGSIIFGTVCVLHLLMRFKTYRYQAICLTQKKNCQD